MQPIHELPTLVTCFAYREEYFAELDGLIATVREFHPRWPLLTGKAPVGSPEFEVSSPAGRTRWRLPTSPELDGGDDDWRKITRLKGWWLRRVWASLRRAGVARPRVLWLDADSRLNGTLDFEVPADAELLAAPWWVDPNRSENGANDTLVSCILLFQGSARGAAARLLARWSGQCLRQIVRLPQPSAPWLDGDQEVLMETIRNRGRRLDGLLLQKLDYDRYCGQVTRDAKRQSGAQIDQWNMSWKMKRPGFRNRDWPPPESQRRGPTPTFGASGPKQERDRGLDEAKGRWSIGIYRGPSPLRLDADPAIPNPVLNYRDVSDRPARFVADPFLVAKPPLWHLFFEILGDDDHKGVIGLAQSRDGFRWRYRQVVLEEPFHLSYPTVFEAGDRYYMVPETIAAKSIRLYGAVDFPTRWSFLGALVDREVSDPSIFCHDGRWYILACQRPGNNDTLCLFHAERLEGPWKEHPCSPVARGNPHGARPGGRVVVWKGKLIRFAQDCKPLYGLRVWAFEITRLDRTTYSEKPFRGGPALDAGGEGWNRARMHHVDPVLTASGLWIAAVDGCG